MIDLIIDAIIFILWFFPATFLLWIFFINVIALKEKFIDGKDFGIFQTPIYLIGLIFVFCDAAYSQTYGSVVLWRLPSTKRWLFTTRLKYTLANEPVESKRWWVAVFYCRYLLEPWDFGHCGRAYVDAMLRNNA